MARCPLLMVGRLAGGGEIDDSSECRKSECAWWWRNTQASGNQGGCEISRLTGEIDGISEAIKTVGSALSDPDNRSIL